MISPGSVVGLVVFVTTSAVGYLLLVAWAVVPLVLLNLDESAVPPRLQVPAEVDVVGDSIGCASGGCWRELELRLPAGGSAAALTDELGAGQAGCEPRSWWDRRRVCTGIAVTGDVLRVSQRYDPSQVL